MGTNRNYKLKLPIEKMKAEEFERRVRIEVINDLIKKAETQLNGDCLFNNQKIDTRVFIGAKIGILKEYVAAVKNMDTIETIIYYKMLKLLEGIEKESNKNEGRL